MFFDNGVPWGFGGQKERVVLGEGPGGRRPVDQRDAMSDWLCAAVRGVGTLSVGKGRTGCKNPWYGRRVVKTGSDGAFGATKDWFGQVKVLVAWSPRIKLNKISKRNQGWSPLPPLVNDRIKQARQEATTAQVHRGDISSLLYATAPPVELGQRPPGGGGGGALRGGLAAEEDFSSGLASRY